MEEDINILEELKNKKYEIDKVENWEHYLLSNKEQIALEHLIKAYKDIKEIEESHRKENGELREKVKQLEEKLEKINKQLDLDYVDNNYIPVSLVEEKIDRIFGEECKKLGSYIKDDSTSEKERIAGGINILNKIKRELL